jgi:hypothetical protein
MTLNTEKMPSQPTLRGLTSTASLDFNVHLRIMIMSLRSKRLIQFLTNN